MFQVGLQASAWVSVGRDIGDEIVVRVEESHPRDDFLSLREVIWGIQRYIRRLINTFSSHWESMIDYQKASFCYRFYQHEFREWFFSELLLSPTDRKLGTQSQQTSDDSLYTYNELLWAKHLFNEFLHIAVLSRWALWSNQQKRADRES